MTRRLWAKPGQDGQGGVAIETVGGIDLRHMLIGAAEGGHLHLGLDAEDGGRIDLHVGRERWCPGFRYGCSCCLIREPPLSQRGREDARFR